MKKIEAFIRHEAFEEIRDHLANMGLPSMSVSEVKGSGRQKGFTESYRQMAEVATQLVGPYHQLWAGSDRAIDDGRWAFQALFALRFGIAGGTTEIQKGIIGERILGLPK